MNDIPLTFPAPARLLAAQARACIRSTRGWKHATIIILLVVTTKGVLWAGDWKPLWNGKDFDGWSTWLGVPMPTSEVPGMAKGPEGKYPGPIGLNCDPLQVFTVVQVDGKPAIRISGETYGVLFSNAGFENYHLRFQFKWGQKKWPPRDSPDRPRDSGLLYHAHTAPGDEGRVWPRSIELQIQEHDVGDLYAVSSMIFVRSKLRRGTGGAITPVFDYDPKGTWNFFAQVPGMPGRCIKNPDNEKPSGEWNTVELVCVGEDSIHIVNGVVVMRLHGATRIDTPTPQRVTSGPIAFQSECAEVFYRDISLRHIDVIPMIYAENQTELTPQPDDGRTSMPLGAQ